MQHAHTDLAEVLMNSASTQIDSGTARINSVSTQVDSGTARMDSASRWKDSAPTLALAHAPRSGYALIVKPIADIAAALLLLVLLLPLGLLIGLLIKLDSPGTILFIQERYGKNGHLFRIYKFRTMHATAPKEGLSPVSGIDPRLTRVGRLLRKLSLDELPQLLNIIRGEMSFIGPRPEQRYIVEQVYTAYERQRFAVTPGITGLWQVSPYRTRPIHEHLAYDLAYIRQLSLYTDLRIIALTLKVMIKSNTH